VQGVSTGFTRELDIVGIGYRADVKGKIARSRWAIRIRSKFCCRMASI
jgi:ribosomal protein L6P/L9E